MFGRFGETVREDIRIGRSRTGENRAVAGNLQAAVGDGIHHADDAASAAAVFGNARVMPRRTMQARGRRGYSVPRLHGGVMPGAVRGHFMRHSRRNRAERKRKQDDEGAEPLHDFYYPK